MQRQVATIWNDTLKTLHTGPSFSYTCNTPTDSKQESRKCAFQRLLINNIKYNDHA
jgi:hypothetical protein